MQITLEELCLSEAEIKQIVATELRAIIRANSERILSNLAYTHAQSFVDSILDDSDKETIKQKTRDCLMTKTLSYQVFKKRDAWETEEGRGTTFLKEAMQHHKPLIFKHLKQAILKRDWDRDISADMGEILLTGIQDILQKGR